MHRARCGAVGLFLSLSFCVGCSARGGTSLRTQLRWLSCKRLTEATSSGVNCTVSIDIDVGDAYLPADYHAPLDRSRCSHGFFLSLVLLT